MRFVDMDEILREKPPLRNMYSCPESDRAAYHEAVWFPHQLFLGTTQDVDAIAEAIHKVLSNIEELRDLDHKAIRNQRPGSRGPRELAAAHREDKCGIRWPRLSRGIRSNWDNMQSHQTGSFSMQLAKPQ